MDTIIELLKSAKGEITAGLVLALLGWLYGKYRAFMKMYSLKKTELERMRAEVSELGATKQEFERLQEALRESESQCQDLQQGLKLIRDEVKRRDEALRESESQQQDLKSQIEQARTELQRAEAQRQEDSRRIRALQSQLEASQAELQRKNESLRQAEAKSHEASRRIEALQQEREREKAKKKIPPMSDDDFLELCMSGEAQKVEEAIMNGAYVNTRDNHGMTALMLAAQYDHEGVAEVLLKYGADVNAKNAFGQTALIRAALCGYAGFAEVLLKHGADVNAKDDDGETALMGATGFGNGKIETASLLRSYGATD